MPTQNYANHRAQDPMLILVSVLFFLAAVVGVAAFVTNHPNWNGIAVAILGLALLQLALKIRRYTLTVQDRVIRLEMRLRLERVLPAEQQTRIALLTLGQLIALRFASDAELPALIEKVLEQNIQERNAIKQLITDWQADHQRI